MDLSPAVSMVRQKTPMKRGRREASASGLTKGEGDARQIGFIKIEKDRIVNGGSKSI